MSQENLVDVIEALYVESDKVIEEGIERLDTKSAASRLGRRRLQTNLENILDTEFDKFELYLLRNLFEFSHSQTEVDFFEFDASSAAEDSLNEEILELIANLKKIQAQNSQLQTTQNAVHLHSTELDATLKGLGGPWPVAPQLIENYRSRLNNLVQRATTSTKHLLASTSEEEEVS
uniref:Uncharacterized protein n=1 Tax=Aureoumbra lagunensis TaxID=44058 RepID=A0A7S3NI21_9STRA|mmetsp:Transcript_25678/g.32302  ORF Transcript_25678/g.32302 Transcript_25678/m.32302 type:complete len:176 (+) Transcript_25678:26-553(+)